MNQTIKELLKNPLVEDFIVFFGMDQLKDLIQRKRGKIVPNSPQTIAVSAPTPAPKNLQNVILALDSARIPVATKWLNALHPFYKKEIEKWEENALKKLFELPDDLKTDLVIALLGPTPLQKLQHIKQGVAAKVPLINDESKAILQEWEAWADTVLKK